ncbi:MFS transporter [Salarchaeum sp. III]|uniref:MFS transporter n=1 Tax=Salarchaeum sp. III TaxID=3107927 RepID=UPI002ED95EC1
MTADRWLYAWALGYAAIGAASVLVPLYALSLGADAFTVGLIAATGAFAGVPGALAWGRLASTTGRYRPFVLLSLGAAAGAFAVFPFVSSVWAVVVANAALLFAAAAAAPVLTLLAVADVPESGWDTRIGRLNEVQGYGWLAGLLAGTVWNAAVAGRVLDTLPAQRWFFGLSAAVTGLAFVLAWRWLPQPTVSIARFGRSTASIERLLRGSGHATRITPFGGLRSFWAIRRLHPRTLAERLTPALATYLGAIFLAFTGFAAFFGPLPAFLTDLGYGSTEVFVVFLASSAASAAFYARAGALATQYGARLVQLTALAARVLLFPAVALVALLPALPGFLALLVLFLVVGVTWAVVAVTATSIVTRLAPPAIRGDALGAYGALGGVATGAGSLLGGWLATSAGYTAAFVAAGGFVLAGAILAARQT